MPSFSFDHLASIYDSTRGFPDAVTQQITQAIIEASHATPQTAFLEVGVGTGRIAAPIALRGHTFTGVDISTNMLALLEEKLKAAGWREEAGQPWGSLPDEDAALTPLVHRFASPEHSGSMRLVLSDITQLPFRAASFDVVIGVHIFHLVDGWQRAVEEALRVLRPGGMLLHCWDDQPEQEGEKLRPDREWRRIVRELGGTTKRPGSPSEQGIDEFLSERGLQIQRWEVATWTYTTTPRQEISYIERRMGSRTWMMSDEIFAASIERLWQWANAYYGDELDVPYERKRRFVISKTLV
jgi:ubiquinone/menaquinone biosynthesis C-methylase UbiE